MVGKDARKVRQGDGGDVVWLLVGSHLHFAKIRAGAMRFSCCWECKIASRFTEKGDEVPPGWAGGPFAGAVFCISLPGLDTWGMQTVRNEAGGCVEPESRAYWGW